MDKQDPSSINRNKRKAFLQDRRQNSSSNSSSKKSTVDNTPLSKGKSKAIPESDLSFSSIPISRTPLSNLTNVSPTNLTSPIAGSNCISRYTKDVVFDTPLSKTFHTGGKNVGVSATTKPKQTQKSKKASTSGRTSRFNINDIPRLNLSNNEDLSEDSYAKRYGISLDYIDVGDAIYKCTKCDAMLWESEMLRGNPGGRKKAYGLCCKTGAVELPHYTNPPTSLFSLFQSQTPQAKNFMDNIRAYNMIFSFTSMGGKVNQGRLSGRGPYVFRLQGQNYHRIGGLLPTPGEQPKFSQLYIFDSENEESNRQLALSSPGNTTRAQKNKIDKNTISLLKIMLDSFNPLVKSFRIARDCFKDNELQDFSLKLIYNRQKDGRTYNLPTTSEVAGLIIGDIDSVLQERDIIIRKHSGSLQRISEMHPSYLPLQYPLLFPYGEDGFHLGIKHRGIPEESEIPRTKLTMREFFCYRIQDRTTEYSLLINSKKLFHQFFVDGYTMVEADRLSYIKSSQKKLRSNTFKNLTDNVENGINEGASSGKRILLPSSFTCGSRYMMQKYLDAMAICKSVGYPDLFITVTCNPNWPEIHRCLLDKKLKAEDRPDIISRIFKIKLDQLMDEFKKEQFFGPIQAGIYAVEFQKRGLPHAHICLFLSTGNKFPNATDVNRFISAEIPDKEEDI